MTDEQSAFWEQFVQYVKNNQVIPYRLLEKISNTPMNLIDPSLIKVGAVLKTRDGRKARVICTDRENSDHPVLAILYYDNGVNILYAYTSVGSVQCGGRNDGSDLVSIWTESPEVDWSVIPPWMNWVAMDENGEWAAYTVKPETLSDEWFLNDGRADHVYIPPAYAPKYSGDWKDSLVERPSR